ncbi:MAG: rod shape-determining protein MreC [Coxiellaceae bacterium]|nr:rod shape-determining protein MreC [Coxiellaceae bacterium]
MFKKRAFFGLRASTLLLIALLLMCADHYWSGFHRFRDRLSVITYPFTAVVDTPIRWAGLLVSSVSNQSSLLAENARLRAHEFLLQAKLQKLLALERENAQLKELLKSTDYIGGKVLEAQLLAADLSPELQQVVIDKGSNFKLYSGQPVLDAYGVMGQVVHVGPLTSKVLLITDKQSAVPVRDYRSGVRAVAVGDGIDNQLLLLHTTATSDIKVGDLFLTSGLGAHFPVGYPVGVVTAYAALPNQPFAKVSLKPAAHMDRTSQVLLSWPDDKQLQQAVQKELK